MKKFFAITMAMVMAMSTTAFAADKGSATIDDSTDGYKQEITVEGKYEENHTADTVISVDVKWDAMNFVYSATSEGEWNPKTHEYDGASTEAGWNKTGKDITVTNHSNAKVKAAFTFDKTTEKTITGTFTKENFELDNAATVALNDPSKAATDTTSFSISGDALDSTATTAVELGKITVTITKVES